MEGLWLEPELWILGAEAQVPETKDGRFLGRRPPDPEAEARLSSVDQTCGGPFQWSWALRHWGSLGCWAGKASLSTAKGLCFLEQTPSTVGAPLLRGAPSISLGDRDSGAHPRTPSGGSGPPAPSTQHSAFSPLCPSDWSLPGISRGCVHTADSSPGLPEWP